MLDLNAKDLVERTHTLQRILADVGLTLSTDGPDLQALNLGEAIDDLDALVAEYVSDLHAQAERCRDELRRRAAAKGGSDER